MRSEDETLLARLIAARDASRPATSSAPCPDAEQVAGLVEGRLLERERDEVLAHLGDCGRCLDAVESLWEDVEAAEQGADARPADRADRQVAVAPRGVLLSMTRRRWIAAAAAVLAVIGAGSWFLMRNGRGGDVASPDGVLVAAVNDLARRDPELFRGFAPLGSAERLAPNTEGTRAGGGIGHLMPRGRLGDLRPTLTWAPDPTATGGYEVEVRPAKGGARVLRRTTTEPTAPWSDAPPLARGQQYVVVVIAQTPLGESRAAAVVDVTTEAEDAAYAARLAAVDASAPPALRDLVKAHLALRDRRLAAAEGFARAHVAAHPADRLGLETLLRVLEDTEADEATALRRRLAAEGAAK